MPMHYAKDHKCCQCGQQAAVFWPICDPDIVPKPYCRPCVDAAKDRVLLALFQRREERLKQQKEA